MPAPFRDISFYIPATNKVSTPEYRDETCLQNYISDFYFMSMNGYKPPYCSRVTIQPAYYGIWKQTRKNGSIIAIAPFFDKEKFEQLDRPGRYRYLLDIIRECMLQLSHEYQWDHAVFEKAYQLVLDKDFLFRFDYPPALSKNRKMSAFLSIEKTERITSVYANITSKGSTVKVKLYEKINSFWYDCSYILVRHTKWFDAGRFGIHYPKGNISIWYSLTDKVIACFQDDLPVAKIDFKKSFWMQLD
jgi:hypothetical protein